MESFLNIILTALGKSENIAIVVLMLGNVGVGFLFWTERKENRVDRNTLLETLGKVTDALNGVKLALVALSGKTLP